MKAFPHYYFPPDNSGEPPFDRGMDLRDYFAAHAPEPGISELSHFLGLPEDFPREPHDIAGNDPYAEKLRKSARGVYDALPALEKLAVCARYKFAHADAMMKAREEQR